jgi:hypothetical protein
MNFSRNNSQAIVKKTRLIAANLMRRLVGRLVYLLRGCLVACLIIFLILLETFVCVVLGLRQLVY